ncbi:MAG: hypothetical protein J6S82_10230 [Bacteroidales bacterium]|nr:hypothetical protein [Bacteroidales bacterium]
MRMINLFKRKKNLDKKQEKAVVCVENLEQIRLHPYRYLGRICGSSGDDAIYVLMDEVLANAFGEVSIGFATEIKVTVDYEQGRVTIEDNGHGFPLEKLVEIVTKSSFGGIGDYCPKSECELGIKEVNAMCSDFWVYSYRDGRSLGVRFNEGVLNHFVPEDTCLSGSGTEITFEPDRKLFGQYQFMEKHVLALIDKYRQLGKDFTISYNAE